jgi:Zn-dependent protease
MPAQVRLGRVAGVPVAVDWSVSVLALLLAYLLAAGVLPAAVPGRTPTVYAVVATGTTLLLLAGVGLHELAHALAARRAHIGVVRITIGATGGETELERAAASPAGDLAVAVAGPLASAGVAAAGFAAAELAGLAGLELWRAGLVWLGVVSALLAVLNLLPGAPLDGGVVLRALLWWRTGDRVRATLAADRVGLGLGAAILGCGLLALVTTGLVAALGLVLVGWLVLGASRADARATMLARDLAGLTVADAMEPAVPCLPGDLDAAAALGRLVAAWRPVAVVVGADGAPVGLVTADALARLATGRRRDGRPALVRDATDPLGPGRTVAPGTPLPEVLGRVAAGPLVVVRDGLPAGLVTPASVTQARRRAAAGDDGTR